MAGPCTLAHFTLGAFSIMASFSSCRKGPGRVSGGPLCADAMFACSVRRFWGYLHALSWLQALLGLLGPYQTAATCHPSTNPLELAPAARVPRQRGAGPPHRVCFSPLAPRWKDRKVGQQVSSVGGPQPVRASCQVRRSRCLQAVTSGFVRRRALV